jgi:hypothetical protein
LGWRPFLYQSLHVLCSMANFSRGYWFLLLNISSMLQVWGRNLNWAYMNRLREFPKNTFLRGWNVKIRFTLNYNATKMPSSCCLICLLLLGCFKLA